MAGIKNVYRSPDAFRLPTWDAAISYPVNSIVAYYDSDLAEWRHYVSIKQTLAGSLDSDIAFDEWVSFSFDSDTLYKVVERVVNDNFDNIVTSLDSDFAVRLITLDSDQDSDLRVFRVAVDSDLDALKFYVDSEVSKFRTDIGADFDSDVAQLNNTVNNYINQLQYGRFYDSEVILTETVDTRLTGISINLANANNIIGDYLDQVQESTTIQWQAATSSIKDFASNFSQSVNGAHKTATFLDSETIISTFTVPAYVSAISYRGVESNLGGSYFTSVEVTWFYEDATTYSEVNELIALDNTTRIQLHNPSLEKRVTGINFTAYNRSGEEAGVNYIQITSAYSAEELRAERANILHFQTITELLRYSPHNDTIAIVHDTNSLYHNEDSEWIASDPRYSYVDTSIAQLNYNFPPGALVNNVRALTTGNNYEYYTKDGSWTLDTNSIVGYDSDLIHSVDSDLKKLTELHVALQTAYNVNVESVDDRIEQNDSEIIRLTLALSTFYRDYVKLKQEHRDHDSDLLVDRFLLTADLETFKTDITYSNSLINDADSDSYAAFILETTTANNTFYVDTAAVIQLLKEDHDSDYEVVTQTALANSIDISLLRNGEVADNDSDIRALERKIIDQDSDIAYITGIAMKYRGLVDVTDSDQVKTDSDEGDVYIVTVTGQAVEGWGAIRGDVVTAGNLVMYTNDYGWTVINNTTNNSSSTNETVGVPAGTILSFPTYKSIPSSFKVCDGSVFDPGLYGELYDVLGSNTLPDLRGYFLRGWSEDDSVDVDGPRAPLTIQQDEFKSHFHSYVDGEPNTPDGVLDGGTDSAIDGAVFNTKNTNVTGGEETRPKNVSVIYAIAMYSGAGSFDGSDSDIRTRVGNHDSDLLVLRQDVFNNDSDIFSVRHDFESFDSDANIRITDHDSDISSLQTKVSTLVGQFNLVQFSTLFDVVLNGGIITAGIEYDITSEVFNTATPEAFCYPDITFLYETQGANFDALNAGRKLDGTTGLPHVSYRVVHDLVGNVTISMISDQNITHDIRLVSTFRTV